MLPFARKLLPLLLLPPALAQDPSFTLAARLVGKPLLLRGGWISDQLEFNSEGQLRGHADVASFTLSGIDITDLAIQGKTLVLHGARVALIATADEDAPLQRTHIRSTTHVLFSLRRPDKRDFHAEEQIVILVHPDSSGSYDMALTHIFATLAELVPSLPTYWQCYATIYLQPATVRDDARHSVEQCVIGDGKDPSIPPAYPAAETSPPPAALSSPAPQFPARAAELGITGSAILHVRVRVQPDGVPVGLQILHPLGGGLDEALLQAVAQTRFRPGMHNGIAVPTNLDLSFQLNPRP